MTQTHQLKRTIARQVVVAAYMALVGLSGVAAARVDDAATPPLYFASPQAAIPLITELIQKADWKTLSRYYDLANSDVERSELESGRFFIRTGKPAKALPSGLWRYKHPFAPGSRFDHAEVSNPDVLNIVTAIDIDQGGGMVQKGRSEFQMRRSERGYQLLPPTPYRTKNYLLMARVVPPEGEALAVGRYAGNLQVAILNNDPGRHSPPIAILLRGVHWAGYRDDPRQWRRRVRGMTAEQPDGTVEYTSASAIAHTLDAPPLTHLAFESGLILPGEEVLVTVPLTPQRDGLHELVISFVASDGEPLLPVKVSPGSPDGPAAAYVPPASKQWEDAMRERERHTGGLAIVRSTSKPDSPSLAIHTIVLPLQIPLSPDPQHERTGGLAADAAARRAGLDRLKGKYLAFYREPLQSWFFMREDGSAVALRRAVDTRATIDPNAKVGYGWRRVALPKMSATAPDEFCRLDENATALLLRPDTFGDLVKVNTPNLNAASDPGTTHLTPQQLWMVLERARERNIELRLVPYAAKGLDTIHLLSAGINTGIPGRGTEPQ